MEVVLADVLQQCRDSFAKGVALSNSLKDEQFHWQPELGAWSVAECLEHLNATNLLMLRNMRDAIRKARERGWQSQKPFELSFFAKKFIEGLEPPVKLKVGTTRDLKPRESVDRDRCMAVWRQTHDELLGVIQGADGLDLQRIKVKSPVSRFVSYRLGTAFYVIPAHDRRHLWQAAQVMELPDFPGNTTRAAM